jgi:16S rRNA (guanine966-N2)-methyltransferase
MSGRGVRRCRRAWRRWRPRNNEVTIRIIAGDFKGRRIKTPATDKVRPTADRVREAWFSILQGSIPGARVLDLFAGSGALGFEALSRGAASVDFVEKHTASLRVIHANATLLNVEDQVTIHRTDALRFAERLQPGAYDVAFADPPYATDDVARLVALFRATPFARLFSIEHSIDRTIEGGDTRRYGDSAVTFLESPLPPSTAPYRLLPPSP